MNHGEMFSEVVKGKMLQEKALSLNSFKTMDSKVLRDLQRTGE
jgi:hypothetical protein